MKAKTYFNAALFAFSMLTALVSKGQVTFHEDTTITLEPYTPPAAQMPGNSATNLDSNEVKLVYWVHGLSGSNKSWGPVANVTEYQPYWDTIGNYPARKVEGSLVDYSDGWEDFRIWDVARHVYNTDVKAFAQADDRDTMNHAHSFVISHSQGGIVARYMRFLTLEDSVDYPSYFGGIATFGTPHGGAQIINSTHPTTGPTVGWLAQGCTYLGAAELQNFLNNKWLIDAFVSSNTLQNITSTTCNGFLSKMVFPRLIESIRKDVGTDYAMGATVLEKLDSTAQQETDFPVVVFYGIEQEPVLWRMLNTMTYTSDTSLAGSIQFSNPFGLNDDNELPAEINNMYWTYKGNEDYYRDRARVFNGIATACIICGPIHMGFGAAAQSATSKATTYQNAHLWLGNANLVWKRLIGARLDTVYSNGYECYCNDQLMPNLVSTPTQCVDAFGNSNKCYTIPSIVQHTIEKPNDGVVPVWSQMAYPGAVRYVSMPTSNHFQERTSNETKNALNALFNGDYSAQFKLNKK